MIWLEPLHKQWKIRMNSCLLASSQLASCLPSIRDLAPSRRSGQLGSSFWVCRPPVLSQPPRMLTAVILLLYVSERTALGSRHTCKSGWFKCGWKFKCSSSSFTFFRSYGWQRAYQFHSAKLLTNGSWMSKFFFFFHGIWWCLMLLNLKLSKPFTKTP